MTYVVFWPYIDRLDFRLDLFEKAFPKNSHMWVNRFDDFHSEDCGAIVVMNGGAHFQDLQGAHQINERLKSFRWVMLVSIGDEGSGQHLEWIDHPNCSIWVQDPKPGKHDKFHRIPSWPLSGYEQVLSGFQKEMQEKPWDWFFSGSTRDIAWCDAIRALPGNGKFYDTHLGYEGLEGYMHHLARSKVVPCRPCFSGPETCRVYDALEAGCIPIVGIHPAINSTCGIPWWPTFGYDWPHYWEYVFGEMPPFPVITDVGDLRGVVQETLNNWTPEQSVKVRSWWIGYKERLIKSLQDEVRRLQQ